MHIPMIPEIIKERDNAFLVQLGDFQFFIPKRALRNNGELTPYGIKCYEKKKLYGDNEPMVVYNETPKAYEGKAVFTYRGYDNVQATHEYKLFFPKSLCKEITSNDPQGKTVLVPRSMFWKKIIEIKAPMLQNSITGRVDFVKKGKYQYV